MSARHLQSTCAANGDVSDDAATCFLHELVATPSLSGGERAAVERFVRAARSLGLEANIDEAGNGVAHRQGHAASERSIALLGHIDTVPGDIPVRLENGVLHGRGSVDAKGPLAAMLFAAARAEIPGSVELHVIAALGEETADSPGANFVAKSMQPDACIIGEPSGWDGVTLGYKGCLTVRAAAERLAAHSAGPESTAHDELVAWWHRVTAWTAAVNAPHEHIFEQVQASIQSWTSESDGLTNRAALTANFRLPVDISPTHLKRELSARTQDQIVLQFFGGEEAYLTPRNDPVVTSLSAGIRTEGGTPRHKKKTGTADFNVVAPLWRCPIAAYGPGDSSLDHTPHEHLEIAEFLRSIRVITTALEQLSEHLTTEAR